MFEASAGGAIPGVSLERMHHSDTTFLVIRDGKGSDFPVNLLSKEVFLAIKLGFVLEAPLSRHRCQPLSLDEASRSGLARIKRGDIVDLNIDNLHMLHTSAPFPEFCADPLNHPSSYLFFSFLPHSFARARTDRLIVLPYARTSSNDANQDIRVLSLEGAVFALGDDHTPSNDLPHRHRFVQESTSLAILPNNH
jgi:hypothetical protein